mgnify:CR=1 FL=1
MSEDQIHYELSIIRTLISESNADLSQQIRLTHDNTLESVDVKNAKQTGEINKMVDGVKWLIGILIVILLGFGSWLAIDHLTLKADHRELKTDFGTVLKVTSPDHDSCIGFKEMVDKYFPPRGSTK